MRIFISYAHQQRAEAQRVYVVLSREHSVFLDERSLSPGLEFHEAIRKEIDASDLVVFLASRESLGSDRYTRSELDLIKVRWPNPHGRVLTLLCDDIEIRELDTYLTAATVLPRKGNLDTEVEMAVQKMVRQHTRKLVRFGAAVGFVSSLVTVTMMNVMNAYGVTIPAWLKFVGQPLLMSEPIESPIFLAVPFAVAVAILFRRAGGNSRWIEVLAFVDVLIAARVAIDTQIVLGPHASVFFELPAGVDEQYSELAKLGLSGALAGAIGAFLCWLAAARASEHARSAASAALVTGVGLVIGAFLLLAINFVANSKGAISGWANYASDPVMIAWQTAVAACLGYAIAPKSGR